MKDQDLEARLAQLHSRSAPSSLRKAVLTKLAEQDAAQPAARPKSRFDTYANLAMAVSIFIAVIAWYMNLRVHPQRLASLLGPTQAERRAERIVQIMGLPKGDPARLAFHDHLHQQLRMASYSTAPDMLLHSTAHYQLLPIDKRKHHGIETPPKDRDHHRRSSSDYRSRHDLAIPGTA